MAEYLSVHWLDIATTILGVIYLILEYRASIALWIVGIIMPAMDVYLYWSHGLYGDAGMAVYYTLAALYGYAAWAFSRRRTDVSMASSEVSAQAVGSSKSSAHDVDSSDNSSDCCDNGSFDCSNDPGISFFPRRLLLRTLACFFIAWGATYYVLVAFTNSTVPLLDSFTNALSFVGLWALARKYVEQWAFWIVVDAISCYLYVVKGIPFKAALYGLYVVIAVMGYQKWKRMATKQEGR